MQAERRKFLHGGDYIFERRFFSEIDTHGARVAIQHIHAKALCRNGKISLFDRPVRERPEYLLSFGLDLWFFTRDVRYNVVNDIHRRNARVAGPGDSLHRCHNSRFNTKFSVYCRQRRSKAHNGAIWIGHDKPFPKAALLLLFRDKIDVIRIDLCDKKRYVLIHPIAGRIADDRIARASECLFRLSCHR